MVDAKRIGRWRVAGWGMVAALLLLPAVAMRFTDEVRWTASDFVFAGALLGGTGLLVELAMRGARSRAYQLGVGIALAAALLLAWIDAAVQVIGGDDQPLNAVYPAILLAALVAALVVRGRPAALSAIAGGTAAALLLMAPVAIVAGGHEPPGAMGLAMFHLGFAALFLLASLLFRQAARAEVAGRATPA